MPKQPAHRPLLVARDGMELGTLPASQVLELLSEGFFRATDHYWEPEEAEWKTLADLQRAANSAKTGAKDEWLSQAAETLTAAAGILGEAAGAVAKNVHSFVSIKKASVEEATRRLLEDYLPQIKNRVQAQMLDKPASAIRSALHNDELMRKVFGASYDCLPRPVKRFISESAFVDFCFQNKTRLFDAGGNQNASGAASASTKEGDKKPS